jgi:leucyl aminopeptidase
MHHIAIASINAHALVNSAPGQLLQGSDAPPKFIHLVYTPPGGATTKVALVGKGVTFDSGGYNLKSGPGSLIDKMKFDMGGAAAVFGAARAIAEMEPAGVEIHFISAACENMINGAALRPGDVIVSAAGKTVEIGNTDAEGRLTLCDALWYAQEKVGASKCLDIATLTGAQIVALGQVRRC